ncbi:MAG: WD40/YVTN/BNR-like repeat-containing protein [Phycisphaerae bacterium]
MTRLVGVLLILATAAGCQSPPANRQHHKMSYGPPPPGYHKIRGESVPNWKPQDMHRAAGRAGTALAWLPLGPRPVTFEFWSGNDDASGRVVSVAPHPIDPNICYIASASGGIWKTVDKGVNWVPLTDELSNLNHGCVALDPSNPDVVYAGTGEYTLQTTGDGLFRSADAGATWTRIATNAQVGSTCSAVIVDPSNPQIIHVTGGSGYSRSTDGGATWVRLLTGRASDLVIDPVNPQVLYLARHSNGIYRSTDGGSTWTKLAGGLPTTNLSRIRLAIAPSNPNVLYTVIIDAGQQSMRGFFRSADGGTTWISKPATPDFPFPQGWYDLFVGVDPTNENIVYGGGVFPTFATAGVIKSTDGGNSWTDITIRPTGQVHPDQQAIAFGPDGTLWIGNDGGVWYSNDAGGSWVNTNNTLTVTQNYNIALHPTDPALLMGGTQDNGTVAREIDNEDWPQIVSGDGGFLAYDPSFPSRRYTTFVQLTVFRLVGAGFADITGPWSADPVQFIAPLIMDPNDPNTLLGGTNRVWRTTNASTTASWTAISPTTVGGGGTLTALAVAQSDSTTIYTGSSNGRVYVTTNDGGTWLNRSLGFTFALISDIVIDPTDPGTAYASVHATSTRRVARTTDFGQNWTTLDGGLPVGVTARALAVDWRFAPPHLYIGTGAGIYCSFDDGTTWIKDGLDLPNVNIGDLAIDPARGDITAGTFGRGAWRALLPVVGDLDGNRILDLGDQFVFTECLNGPDEPTAPINCTQAQFFHADFTGDNDVDEEDFARFMELMVP